MIIPRRRFLIVAAGGVFTACTSKTSGGSDEGIGGSGGTACLGDGAGAGLDYCLVEKKTIRIANGARLAVGQAVIVGIDDNSAAVLARDGRGFFALSATCPHACCTVTLCGGADCKSPVRPSLACTAANPAPLAASGATFFCPCHGSQFGADGAVLSGPARDPLPSVVVRIDGGDVVVDLSTSAPVGTRVV